MQNKLKVFAATVIAAATLGLASCDVDANLTKEQGDVAILNGLENDGIYSNRLQAIYDEIVISGTSTSERVLNNMLLAIGESKFGPFYTKDDVEGVSSIVTKSDDLIAAWVDANHFNSVYEGDTAAKKAAKVKDFYETVENAIRKTFYNATTNATYQKRNMFHEELYVKSLRADLYSLADFTGTWGSGLSEGTKDYRNVEEYFHGGTMASILSYYQDYVERSLIPTIYRKALVEQYLFDYNWNTLGRTYARKVQYVSLPQIDGYEGATEKLIRSYAKNVIEKTDAELTALAAASSITLDAAKISEIRNLHYLDRLYSGYFEDADWDFANLIYKDASFDSDPTNFLDKDADTNATYKQTIYGKIVKDWREYDPDRLEGTTGTDFTGSGTYSRKTGLEIRRRQTIAASKVTEGWYTSSGLSDLPSAIRSRLFRNSVAAEVDIKKENGNVRDGMSYGWYINGDYYMIPEKYSADNAYPYIQYDSGSSTYYVVRVDEAVRYSKMSKDSTDGNYDAIGGELTLNKAAWKVCDLIADGDSYKKAANQHYVQEAALSFHDDTVYEYFESTFPDLFED